ncbi:transcriptional regulator [Campylobacter sp.]|uniref:transcriptional regulator n=1 Tax=Campylobacter sp. TaxID=205 RepID=UPI0025BBDC22|nr:transcriptional regulator [Campylobacter sp.]
MAQKSKRDMAYHLGVDVSTLYNWRKYKPNLYRIVMLGFKFDELLEKNRKNYEELLEINQTIQDEIAKFK